MSKLTNDLSVITTIPENILDKLNDKALLCIAHDFHESILKNKAETTVDIGYGILTIINEDDIIKYKFQPNDTLEKTLIDISLGKKEPLQKTLEEHLCAKIIKTYKDIF